MGAAIRAVHDVIVGPFEIEGIDQGFAQLRVLELLSPRVNEPALRGGWSLVGQHIALDAAVADRWKVVARSPDAGGELFAEEIGLGSEPFESDVAVAVIFVAQDIEIVAAAIDCEASAPP